MSSDSAGDCNAIERVARALKSCKRIGETVTYEELARAAIAAIAEPTEAMRAAASRLNHPRDVEIWRAMIAAALQEGEDDGC